MQLPARVTFRGVPSSEAVEAEIRELAAKLDTYHDRITSCRVVVEVPHRHHQGGKHYRVRIELSLPGGEAVVNHEPSLHASRQALGLEKLTKGTEPDGVHKDLRGAIHEAFDVVRRRLQDYARRHRRDVKTHEPPPHGRIVRLFPKEGYGFIETADGREVYFHQHSVLNDGFKLLAVGTQVSFAEERGEMGPQASSVRLGRKQHSH